MLEPYSFFCHEDDSIYYFLFNISFSNMEYVKCAHFWQICLYKSIKKKRFLTMILPKPIVIIKIE